ncbi:MAG: serine/threonine protein kinase [Euryarchaeota archaeon]|nr:serine/threonine protein kinase [Euryarchaeota archaeon]
MAPPSDAVLSFGSGVPLVVLGAVLLAVRPRRAPQVFFGLFGILWGIQIMMANFGRLTLDPDRHAFFLLLSGAFFLVATLFLVHFAALVRHGRRDWITTGIFGAFAVAGLVTMIVDPRKLVDHVVLEDGGLTTRYGELAVPFFQIPFHAALLYAVTVLYLAMRSARPGTSRHRLRGMLIAVNIFVSYQFTITTLRFLDFRSGIAAFATGAVETASTLSGALLVTFFLAGSLYFLTMAFHAVARPPPPEGRDSALIASFFAPGAVAVLEVVLAQYRIPMETLGFWRFLMVGVLVYTLANYQLFDLELKVKRFAAPGLAGILAIFGVPIAVGLALGDYGLEAMMLIVIPEVIGTAGVLVFHERVAEALFPGVKDEPDYHHQRRLELYKVALEEALARGRDAEDPEFKELRVRFGVSQEEHNLLVWVSGHGTKKGASDGHELKSGTVLLDRYRIDRILGRGTQRVTYLATDTKSRRSVAVKVVRTDVLDGAAARLLLRDARLGASIAHPNVLAIFDVAELDDTAVIVMDYADEGNLQDRLLKRGHMTLSAAVRFLGQLLAALEAIHERGIVHRNLKPKNVLLDNDGSVLLADFSAAHASDGRLTGDATTDEAARALLDVLYLSPEQVASGVSTPKSDLYVAAVLFHQAYTNRFYLPIQGKDDSQIRDLILEREPELHLPHDTPDWVETFLRQALAKAPDERFEDAAAMRAELHEQAGLAPVGRWPGFESEAQPSV